MNLVEALRLVQDFQGDDLTGRIGRLEGLLGSADARAVTEIADR